MSPYEITDIISFPLASLEHGRGDLVLEIEVRIWHDDAAGMSAEAVSYRWATRPWVKVNTYGATPIDELIIAAVEKEYTDELLGFILQDEPAFDDLPYDENPISQSEYQDMRI
tara:strand:- start:248 stop:586 length:339 start_codon:yes stop_codon:yes gene_type:complete